MCPMAFVRMFAERERENEKESNYIYFYIFVVSDLQYICASLTTRFHIPIVCGLNCINKGWFTQRAVWLPLLCMCVHLAFGRRNGTWMCVYLYVYTRMVCMHVCTCASGLRPARSLLHG